MLRKTYQQELRDFYDEHGCFIKDAFKGDPLQAAEFGFNRGAKVVAGMLQELGEIYASVSQSLTPADVKRCQAIFAKNKEVVDATK